MFFDCKPAKNAVAMKVHGHLDNDLVVLRRRVDLT